MAKGYSQGDKVAERIRCKAQLSGIHTDALLRRYALERALHRIVEAYGAKVMLKGSMVAFIDDPEGARPVPDIDAHLSQREDIEIVIPDILTRTYYDSSSPTGLLEDHIQFTRFRFEPLRHSGEPGVKVRIEAMLGVTRVNTSLDIGFGHGTTSDLEIKHLPPMFKGLPPVVVYCQPVADSIADKVKAMIDWGMDNTRVKDFYDIAARIHRGQFDASAVAEALAMRDIDLSAIPAGISNEYVERHEVTWQSWLKKSGILDARSLADVVDEIRQPVQAALLRAARLRSQEQKPAHLRLVASR